MKRLTLPILPLVAAVLSLGAPAHSTGSSTTDLGDGLVAHYAFDGNMNDSAANANHGIPFGGATFGTDRNGNANSALSLDGDGDFVRLAHRPYLNISAAGWSVALWFKGPANQPSGDNFYDIVDKEHGDAGWAIQGNDDTTDLGLISCGGSPCTPSSYVGTSGSGVLDDQWHCLVGTFVISDMSFFFDGVETASGVPVPPGANSGNVAVGRHEISGTRYFLGLVDDLRIYDRVLSNDEISEYCNETPLAADDTATVDEDSNSNTINVLANDSDPDGDTLTITGNSDPTNGSADCSSGTSCSYTPNGNYSGPDSFTYAVNDGNGGTDTATVDVTVTAVNDAPDAVDDDAGTVLEDSAPTTIDVLTNDSDVDGDTLTITQVTQGSKGTVAITDNGTTVSYTPNANANGDDSFTYTISDGQGNAPADTDTATVDVSITPVNDAPDAVNDAATVDEDAAATDVPVLANDTDVDGDTLTITEVTQPANGTVLITGGGTGLTYQPNSNFDSPPTDPFTYTISDGQGSSPSATDTATVTITVTPVNDAPVLDNSGNPTLTAVNENATDPPGDLVSAVIASGAGGNPISDVDEGAVEGIAVFALDSTNGTWQYSLDGGANWTTFAPVSEDAARLLASDASTKVRFVPNAGFDGTVDPGLRFRAWDRTAGDNGGTASVTLNGGTTPFSSATESAAVTVTPSEAQSSCSFVGTTLSVQIGAGNSVAITRSGNSFAVSGPGIVDETCGGATMTNVDLVDVDGATGDESLTIDESAGRFVPGVSLEDDIEEIEFAIDLGLGSDSLTYVATPFEDAMWFGSLGINPNPDTDADVTLAGIEAVSVNLGDRSDVITGAGGRGTGDPFPISLTIDGGGGNDILTGGAAADVELGGSGNDKFKEVKAVHGGDGFAGGPGKDLLTYAARTVTVTVTLDGVANDGADGENDNAGTDVEKVTGGKKNDNISGSVTVANLFKGGAGNDTLNAQDGVDNDTVDGDAGTDTCIADAGDTKRSCEL